MRLRKKDPKKVAAGRKGGRVSGGNFKNSRERAILAGQKSAWKRNGMKLEDFPIPMIDPDGNQVAMADKGAEKRRNNGSV